MRLVLTKAEVYEAALEKYHSEITEVYGFNADKDFKLEEHGEDFVVVQIDNP